MRLPAGVALLLLSPALARAATITVTTTADELADTGTCSLREAIIAANGNQTSGGLAGECLAGSSNQADTIVLPAGTFHLTRSGDEGPTLLSPAIGDLDVYGSVEIQGQGPALTVISAAGLGARAFHIDAPLGFFAFSGLSIRDGDAVDGAGGGIYLANGYALSLSSVEISGNHAALEGGGVAVEYAELALDHAVISDNRAGGNGGGIYQYGAGRTVVLTDSSLSGNRAEGSEASGGGIYVLGPMLAFSRCTVSNNHATFRGGGLMTEIVRAFSASASTFSGNEAETGGGIYHYLPSANSTIESSTVSGNRATAEGGGIALFPSRGLTLRNSTLAENLAGSGASTLVGVREGTFANSILAGTCARVEATSLGGNLESPGDSCGLDHVTDQVAVGADELALGPLADNGGPTLTHRPAPESVAVDHGLAATCPAADQRGIARPYGAGCDVGAVELGEEPCGFSGDHACLLGGRFRVNVGFATSSATGIGQVMRFAGVRAESDQSAFFSFFDNANFEMGVKMIDACAVNDSFWVFVSGLTNQAYTVSIQDTASGATRSYSNPLGTYPQTLGATDGASGFNCTPGTASGSRAASAAEVRRGLAAAPPDPLGSSLLAGLAPTGGAAAGSCVAGLDTACHLDGRFEVGVDWTTAEASGAAQVMSFAGNRASSDQSSFWWFFDPANFEMGVKMVDACYPPFNATWVFVSGLTNQGFSVHIKDTISGLSRTYTNPLGQYPQTVGATTEVDGFPCGTTEATTSGR